MRHYIDQMGADPIDLRNIIYKAGFLINRGLTPIIFSGVNS
jgi:hypothetical protein